MTVIVEKSTGRMLRYISGDAESIKLNTPDDCIAVDDPPERDMYRAGDVWIPIPPSPSPMRTFDYTSKTWIDTRTLAELKEQSWARLKQQRDAIEFGGFEYEGNIYDSDQVSQGRLMGAAIAGVDQVWTLANNTTVNLTGDELKELYATLQRHIASLHERGRIARFNIDAATTPQDIEAVTL